MINKAKTKEELIAVVSFIICNYDTYCGLIIEDKKPTVEVEENDSSFNVKINYIGEITPGSGDGPMETDDEFIIVTEEFTLLKSEGFKQLSKYVEDVCEIINENDLYK